MITTVIKQTCLSYYPSQAKPSQANLLDFAMSKPTRDNMAGNLLASSATWTYTYKVTPQQERRISSMSQIFHGILISTDQTACATDFVVFESPFPFNLDLSLMGF